MADCVAELMTGSLGYQAFAAQGGDWGAFVGSRSAIAHADSCRHPPQPAAVRRDPAMVADPDAGGAPYLEELALG